MEEEVNSKRPRQMREREREREEEEEEEEEGERKRRLMNFKKNRCNGINDF